MISVHNFGAFICLMLLMNGVCCMEFFKFLNDPNYDGVRRAKHLRLNENTKSDLMNLVAQLNTLSRGLLLVVDADNERDHKADSLDEFVELSAQLLEKRNISVYRVLVPREVASLTSDLVSLKPGSIILYYSGRKYQYYGRRDALSLLSFVLKLNENKQIKVINGKLDKVAYDAIQSPKVVGFFMPGTPDYNEFVTAAATFNPSVPFFVVNDRAVAKHLKLETVGQIILVKPFEKIATLCPQNPATAADIEAFVLSNRGIALTHLNEHNLHDPSIFSEKDHLILAIGEQNSPIGGYFHRLITKLIKNVTTVEHTASDSTTKTKSKAPKVMLPEQHNANILQNVSIVWVDLQSFPTIYLMMDQLERVLNFPPGLPFYFGSVNISSNHSVWFNTSSLNTTGDKGADEENIRVLNEWINGIVTSVIKPVKIGVQSFVKKPIDIVVNEGDNFTLECLVENPVGDCLWLKDGQNIGFNLNRYANHYAWRGQQNTGDCSLLVNGADYAQDAGQWVCEVTGDHDNPTITSNPAVVSVVPTVIKIEL